MDGPGLPTRQGYAVGLRTETEELERHARLLIASEASGDLSGIRRHAEHLYNLIAGARDPRFGDLDGDGHAQNAGDGFGLLPNDQPGYIGAVQTSAHSAAADANATPAIQIHAAHVDACADNLHGWAIEARGLALAKWVALGNDANGDGEISPIPGEGGARVAFEHAVFMAGLVPETHADHRAAGHRLSPAAVQLRPASSRRRRRTFESEPRSGGRVLELSRPSISTGDLTCAT